MEPVLEGWTEFNLALAGAATALAGLLIVAMSVNIRELLKARTLLARAAASIAAVVLAVAASLLALVPELPVWVLGSAVLVGAAVAWAIEVTAIRAIASEPGQALNRVLKAFISVAPVASFTIGGVLLAAGSAGGYVWVAAASVLAIIGAVLFSWVALVEILR